MMVPSPKGGQYDLSGLSKTFRKAINEAGLGADVCLHGLDKDLMSNLLVSEGSPTGQTRLSEWLERNAETVGTRYISELRMHYR